MEDQWLALAVLLDISNLFPEAVIHVCMGTDDFFRVQMQLESVNLQLHSLQKQKTLSQSNLCALIMQGSCYAIKPERLSCVDFHQFQCDECRSSTTKWSIWINWVETNLPAASIHVRWTKWFLESVDVVLADFENGKFRQRIISQLPPDAARLLFREPLLAIDAIMVFHQTTSTLVRGSSEFRCLNQSLSGAAARLENPKIPDSCLKDPMVQAYLSLPRFVCDQASNAVFPHHVALNGQPLGVSFGVVISAGLELMYLEDFKGCRSFIDSISKSSNPKWIIPKHLE
jgi:hypothetical protein